MDVTVSNKYQIVIPKAVRRQLHILPGQKLRVESSKDKKGIIIRKAATIDQIITKHAGAASGAWGKDPMATLQKTRDEEWQN
jgi:AbrB family looped-hinge helix DNA binding protein